MAAPVIRDITVIYPAGQTYVSPGQQVRIVVDAVDPDSTSVNVAVTVCDGSGKTGSGSCVVVVSDPLTYAATSSAGIIAATQAAPSVFVIAV